MNNFEFINSLLNSDDIKLISKILGDANINYLIKLFRGLEKLINLLLF